MKQDVKNALAGLAIVVISMIFVVCATVDWDFSKLTNNDATEDTNSEMGTNDFVDAGMVETESEIPVGTETEMESDSTTETETETTTETESDKTSESEATNEPAPEPTPEPEPEPAPQPEPTPQPGPVIDSTPGTFTAAPAGYFSDALFVGDSRTIGLKEYGDIKEADYFATTGMSVYDIGSQTVSINGVGSVSFSQLLASKQYGKVYILLGINEIGDSASNIANKYSSIVQQIRSAQPNATIFIQANFHTGKEKSETTVFNNGKINSLNEKLAAIANGIDIYYLAVNTVYDDAEGNLASQYTGDGVHLYAKYYYLWTDYLRGHAIIR